MPYGAVILKPGLDTEATATYEQAAFDQIELGRFKAGLFQKLGGWRKFYPLAVGGKGRQLHAWQDLKSVKHLAVATTTELDVITAGALKQVSPQVLISNIAPNFSTVISTPTVTVVDANITNVTPDDQVEFLTPVSIGGVILSGVYRIITRTGLHSYTITARTNATATAATAGTVPVFDTVSGSASIAVTLANHAQLAGNDVVFPVATSVGGVVIEGRYTVISITNANVFVINANTAATSTATATNNSGLARLRYHLALGPGGAGLGYGLGAYGAGPYGLGGGAGTDQTGTALVTTDWTLDNWGELLLACPRDEGLYFWGPNSGFLNMSLVVEAPIYNRGMFVSMSQQQVLVYGSSLNAWDPATQISGVPGIGVFRDPLLLQWCEISDFFDWEARITNQAGNFRIPTGSEIVAGGAMKNRNLFWTDLDLYAQTYIGQPDVYSTNKVGSNCGIIGQHAWGQQGDATYWMGKRNFFVYAGAGVLVIPCTVWDAVFQNISAEQSERVACGSNTDFTEMWWFYPSRLNVTGYPDLYVKYNTIDGTWEAGPMDRLSWIDRSVLGYPIAIDNSGVIFEHEASPDADGSPLLARMRTSYFYLDEAETFSDVDELVPDFIWGEYGGDEDAELMITLYFVETPGETPQTTGPYLVTKASTYISLDPPIRAKQIAVEIASEDVGSFWRIGRLRYRYAPAGSN